MGLEANPDVSYKLRDEVIPTRRGTTRWGRESPRRRWPGPVGEARLGIPYGAASIEEGLKTYAN
jgi:hypothetical protein